MIAKALEMLINQVEQATKDLTEARARITDSFDQDYVVTSSTLENLIKAQYSVRHWAKVEKIIKRGTTDEAKIAGLEEWMAHTIEQLLECGRSRSTSLIASAEFEAEEDELKQVLRQVKQFVRFARSHS